MSEIIYSKKGQRKLSPFVGQELLYDFYSKNLDSERSQAVQKLLDNSVLAQADLEKIASGMSYVEQLRKIDINEQIKEQIQTPSTYLQVGVQKLKVNQWPSGVRIALQSLVVTVGIVSISMVVPWHKLLNMKVGSSRSVILTEISRDQMIGKGQSEMAIADQKADTTVFPDEGSGKQVKAESQNLSELTVAQFKFSEQPPQNKAADKKQHEKEVPVKSSTLPAQAAKTEVTTEQKTTVAATKESSSEKRQGFLYRGTATVTNVSSVSPKYVEKIQELGGRKAGAVELGWKKGTGTYFHFTIPEAKYQTLIDFINQFGKIKIEKEQHDRVMPDGIIRLIIQVEEKGQ